MSKRGLAAMSPEKRREIQSKGGIAISKDRGHMSKIGRAGGLKTMAVPGWAKMISSKKATSNSNQLLVGGQE